METSSSGQFRFRDFLQKSFSASRGQRLAALVLSGHPPLQEFHDLLVAEPLGLAHGCEAPPETNFWAFSWRQKAAEKPKNLADNLKKYFILLKTAENCEAEV